MSSIDPVRLDAALMERAISELPEVTASRVVRGAGAKITEIHIVARPGKSVKQIVRDIQTLALARFGVDIDYRIVSVVQLETEQTSLSEVVGVERKEVVPRPILASVAWRSDGSSVSCSVDLEMGDSRETRTAHGPATPSARLRLAAEATLDALAGLLAAQASVASVDRVSIAATTVIVVLVDWGTGPAAETLVGASLVRTDESEGAARAVLDALNRRLAAPRLTL